MLDSTVDQYSTAHPTFGALTKGGAALPRAQQSSAESDAAVLEMADRLAAMECQLSDRGEQLVGAESESAHWLAEVHRLQATLDSILSAVGERHLSTQQHSFPPVDGSRLPHDKDVMMEKIVCLRS